MRIVLLGITTLLLASFSAHADGYIFPSQVASNDEIQKVFTDVATLLSSGTYDGVDSTGAKCTVGIDFVIGDPHIHLNSRLRIYPGYPMDFSFPRDYSGTYEAEGRIYILSYSYSPSTTDANGEINLAIANGGGFGGTRLASYKIKGKAGTLFSLQVGMDASPFIIESGVAVTIDHQYPECSHLVKGTSNLMTANLVSGTSQSADILASPSVIGHGTSNAWPSDNSGCAENDVVTPAITDAEGKADTDAAQQCDSAIHRITDYEVTDYTKLRGALCLVQAQATYVCNQ